MFALLYFSNYNNVLEDKLPFLLNKFDGGGFRAADLLEAAERLGAVSSVPTRTHSKLLTDTTRLVRPSGARWKTALPQDVPRRHPDALMSPSNNSSPGLEFRGRPRRRVNGAEG